MKCMRNWHFWQSWWFHSFFPTPGKISPLPCWIFIHEKTEKINKFIDKKVKLPLWGTTFYNREKLPAINHLVLNTLIMLLLKTTLLVPQTKLPSNWGRSWRRLYRRRHFLFGSTFCCLDQSGLTQIKRQLPMSLILWLTSFTFSTPTASMLLLSLLLVRWSMSLLEEFFVKLLPARLNSFVKIQINHKPFPFSCLSTYNEWTLVFHSCSIEKSFFFEGKREDLFSRKIKKNLTSFWRPKDALT